jgi:hypothetical protein
MSVDYAECSVCGDIVCDCGDDWNYCDSCGRIICTDCLANDYEIDEETGEMSKECCPYCSGTIVHNDDLLEFMLRRANVTREQAVELYRNEEAKECSEKLR